MKKLLLKTLALPVAIVLCALYIYMNLINIVMFTGKRTKLSVKNGVLGHTIVTIETKIKE
jgi:hypothetical protein